MRALAVCQDELVIRTLHRVLAGAFDLEFIVESRPLARRLVDDGVPVTIADPKRVDSYLRADLTPNTCVIVEDSGKRSLKRVLTAIRDAGGTLLYVQVGRTVRGYFYAPHDWRLNTESRNREQTPWPERR